MTRRSRVFAFSRALGLFAGASCVALWVVVLYANPYTGARIDAGTRAVAWLMIALALLGALASLRASARGLGVAAVVSFTPVGLYVALTPGSFRWIGVLDLLMLLAALGLWWSAASRRDHT